MNPNDVIDSYVADVMRRVPARDRNDIGLELRDLLGEMLADRARTEGTAVDDAMVLAVLRDFGAPAEIAARYRPAEMVIIPADQTRSFALLSIGGVALQWAMSLPRVFAGQPLVAWWFSWGLGSLWWPGFLVMTALVAAWIGRMRPFGRAWRPRTVDPERVNRGALAFGLLWYAIAVAMMISLPWTTSLMPGPLPHILAFDPAFLRTGAPLVLLLWFGQFALLVAVFARGRWSPLARRLEIAFSLAFAALLAWLIVAGDIFLAKPTNDGARAGLALVILIIVLDLAVKLYRRRPRIRAPKLAG